MKKIILSLIIFAILILFTGCPKENEGFDDDPVNQTGYTIHTNPSSGTIFSVVYGDGKEATFFGDKDESGMPVKITGSKIKYAGDPDYYITYFDDNMMPSIVYAPNGSVFEYEWVDETSMRVKAISPNGQAQLTIPIGLDTLQKKALASKKAELKNIREGIAAIFNAEALREFEPKGVFKNVEAGNISVSVEKCGYTVGNAAVQIYTNPPLGTQMALGTNHGGGNYSFNLPQSGTPADYEKMCDDIAQKVNELCTTIALANLGTSILFGQQQNSNKKTCDLISNYIQNTYPNSQEAQKLLTVCSKAVGVIPTVCEFHSNNDLASTCKLGFLLQEEPTQTSYQATFYVTVPGDGTIVTESVTINPNEPSSWEITLPGEFNVAAFYTFPGDPNPSQGYTAYANIVCPDGENGTDIVLSVVGTDGYTQSRPFVLYEGQTISIDVPGGAEGVVDVITVTANAQEWQISIVF